MAPAGGTFCGITEDIEVINDISIRTMKQEGNTETESCVLCAQYNASWLNGSIHYRTLMCFNFVTAECEPRSTHFQKVGQCKWRSNRHNDGGSKQNQTALTVNVLYACPNKVLHIRTPNMHISQYVHASKLSWQHDDAIASHLALYSILPYPEAITEGVISIVEGREEVLNEEEEEATVSPSFYVYCMY